uniref:BTB domain-containing protein n=1 Tax=Chromera velia CCMP2878 TaxID=1169474 RepID=A0A0G4GWD0_9ALVE|eukprot:Cvel_23650.t1-p1 / transcript=Cvel_23650.t1 / gene=Cvel_23650 / organism=Chromera_velia_CCMP2878 / gene_product=ARM REPEAT PROTEIN INTERACTING WITH ABF2, putative / transcript_product=ARM REPEAT PROTEIN INTERACTING WITH ABF2, putative / location=Cvel_scaffold2462:3484-3870(-) / protein_length=129 / sequence_SO=supercontig / SO=protein_coding / is_pseudo=false
MEALLNDKTLSDVTFIVGGARIHALRAILIRRSEYFRTMLTSGFAEGQEGCREITIGNTTPEAFKAILCYLHTDELRFPGEHLMEVMHKAEEIQLERVYEYAVGRASRLLSVHNVVTLFTRLTMIKRSL